MQQLKQLMTDLDANNQQFPTLGILYAFVTSFDIDRENKPMIASRWLVRFLTVPPAGGGGGGASHMKGWGCLS